MGWAGHQALVAKEILFLSNRGSKGAGPQNLVAKKFLPFSNGSSKGVQPGSQKRRTLLVKFKTLEMAKQKVPGQIQNTTGPGCPGAKQGSGSGGPGLLSPHSPGLLAIRWPSPRGWENGSSRVGRKGVRDTQGSRESEE